MPANSGVTLGPGDSLISRSETAVQITVGGAEPAELLNWILVDHSSDPDQSEEHVRHEWIVKRDDMEESAHHRAALPAHRSDSQGSSSEWRQHRCAAGRDARFVMPVGIAQSSGDVGRLNPGFQGRWRETGPLPTF